MGSVSILVKNGGYQFGPTDRTHPGFGHHNRRTRLPNIRGGVTTECTWGVSLAVGTAMAELDAHKTKLAKECNHLSTGKD